MGTEKARYPEKQIQLAFVEWYSSFHGYVEKIDDVEGFKGSPMDSVGFIADRPVLIEVKHLIPQKMVLHADSPAASLELKIVRTLKSLYGAEVTCFTDAMRSWNRKTVPLIVIVAKSISAGAMEKLRGYAGQYAQSWQFSLAVYEWNGTEGICRYERLMDDATFSARLPDLPAIRAVAPVRAKGLCLEDVSSLLAEKGLQSVLHAFLECMGAMQGKPDPGKNRSNLNFKLPDRKTGRFMTVAGIWPFHSSAEKGVLFSFNAENIAPCLGTNAVVFARLPGVEGPVVGFQNSHKYLRSPEEVRLFWKMLKLK